MADGRHGGGGGVLGLASATLLVCGYASADDAPESGAAGDRAGGVRLVPLTLEALGGTGLGAAVTLRY